MSILSKVRTIQCCDPQIDACISDAIDESRRLEAELAAAKERAQTARREALEEAARVADNYVDAADDGFPVAIAAEIRALIEKGGDSLSTPNASDKLGSSTR